MRSGVLAKTSEKRKEETEGGKQVGSSTDHKRARNGKGFVAANLWWQQVLQWQSFRLRQEMQIEGGMLVTLPNVLNAIVIIMSKLDVVLVSGVTNLNTLLGNVVR